MSITEAASRLGIGASTLYSALKRGDIPVQPIMIGRTRRLSRRMLESGWPAGMFKPA